MNKIEYLGYTFFYKVKEYPCGEYDMYICHETQFYKKTGKGTRKKYYLWGPEIEYNKYKELFTFDYNIEDCDINKEKIREDLSKEINRIKRCEEIKKGKIV